MNVKTIQIAWRRHSLIHLLDLVYYMEANQLQGTTYRCKVCNKTFTQISALSKHDLIHVGIKKFKCDICAKVLSNPHCLSQHKLIHAGIKKYQREICNKAFIHIGDLLGHKLIHNNINISVTSVAKPLMENDVSYNIN